jgi:hypothetical protein
MLVDRMLETNETVGVHLEGFAFGMTDGIICFLGIIIGVAQATQDPVMVIIAGIVGGVADAFGNSIGFLISQITEQSIQKHQKENLGQEVRVHTQREVIFSGIFSLYVAKIGGKNQLKMGLLYAIIGITGTFLAFMIGSLLNQII